MVNDVMEQTLTSTSKVIADWMRDGIATPSVAEIVDPFYWMDCGNPSSQETSPAETQPATILIERPRAVVSPVREIEEAESHTITRYYVTSSASVAANSGGVCCASLYPTSTLESVPTSSSNDLRPPTFSLPNNHTHVVSFDDPLDGLDSNRVAPPPSVNSQQQGYQFNLDDTLPTYKKSVDGSSGNTHSARSQRSYLYQSDTSIRTDRTSKTDLNSVHSFLMVSHAPVNPLLQAFQQKENPRHQKYPPNRDSKYLPSEANAASSEENEPLDCVLTPSLMQQLQRSFPMLKRGDSFWLQYSLVRDGASLQVLLQKVTETVKHSVLAIETTEGEIFGAFLAHPWRRSKEWYGSGESFLWTTTRSYAAVSSRNSRRKATHTVDERRIRVFSFSFENPYVQRCTGDSLLLGSSSGNDGDFRQGFGLAIDGDLMMGSSHPCRTFGSPSLSRLHADGTSFEIRNLEVWNLTPCLSMVEKEGQTVVHRRRKSKRQHGRRQNDRHQVVCSIDESSEFVAL
jgi:hypothetical protein